MFLFFAFILPCLIFILAVFINKNFKNNSEKNWIFFIGVLHLIFILYKIKIVAILVATIHFSMFLVSLKEKETLTKIIGYYFFITSILIYNYLFNFLI